MPLLKREIDSSPPELFELDLPWSVLHVRSRQEKGVARFLLDASVPFYLPQAEKRVRKNGRNFVSFLPLFPGYVFCRLPREEQSVLWRNASIVRLLPVEDQPLLGEELLQLSRLQAAGAALVPHPYLTVGDQVRITEGVFAGYRGVVVREKGTLLLVVSVSVINHSVAVELGRDAVSPAPSPACSA